MGDILIKIFVLRSSLFLLLNQINRIAGRQIKIFSATSSCDNVIVVTVLSEMKKE
jgi:hypothetical protein